MIFCDLFRFPYILTYLRGAKKNQDSSLTKELMFFTTLLLSMFIFKWFIITITGTQYPILIDCPNLPLITFLEFLLSQTGS